MLELKKQRQRSQLTELKGYLGISTDFGDDLITAEYTRMAGTCEWFLRKPSYLRWKCFTADTPQILWINANPGSGKTILAGHIIGQLREAKASFSYYFFKHGDELKTKLSTCLRHLAFQVACTSVHAQATLLKMRSDGISLDDGDERALWRKLFLPGVFYAPPTQHYWVIDGLDECSGFVPFLETMLSKLDRASPLRILITSRGTLELGELFLRLGPERFQSEAISRLDTLADVGRLISERVKTPPAIKHREH